MKIYGWILIAFCFISFGLSGYKLFLVYTHPVKYIDEIKFYATQNNISPALVASVINTESGFNKYARSSKNAIGLMQIKLSTANYLNDLSKQTRLTEDELFLPNINIEYGCKYLKYLNSKFESVETCLAAYNAGETRVRTWLKDKQFSTDEINLINIPFEETKNYIKKIKNNLKYYKNIFN